MAGRTLHDCLDALDIGLPCTIGTTVRVGDLNTKCDALAADFAFCHSWHLLYRLVNTIYCNRNREKNQVFFSDFFKFISFHENLTFLPPKDTKFIKPGGQAGPASIDLKFSGKSTATEADNLSFNYYIIIMREAHTATPHFSLLTPISP